MRITHLWTVLIAGLSLVFGADAGDARSKSLIVQVGSQVPSVSVINFFVAEKVGFLAEEDLDIEIRYTANAPTATQIVAAGNADIGVMTNEPIILGYDKGVRAKMFLSLQGDLNYYLGIPEDSPVRTLADLKGKNIGVSNLGSAAVPVLRSMMRTVGAEAGKDFTLVPVGVLDQAIAALKSNRVAAVAMWESQYAAFYRIGFPFRYIRHPTLGNFGNNGFMVSEQTAKTKAEAVCGMGRAVLKALIFVRENPEATLDIYWEANPAARSSGDEKVAREGGMREIAYITKSYFEYKDGVANFGAVDRAGFQRYMQLLKDDGALKEIPPLDDLMTDAFIPCINKIDAAALRKKAREWKK
jgi:NitT/TauT family transport system substrate-binding protein